MVWFVLPNTEVHGLLLLVPCTQDSLHIINKAEEMSS